MDLSIRAAPGRCDTYQGPLDPELSGEGWDLPRWRGSQIVVLTDSIHAHLRGNHLHFIKICRAVVESECTHQSGAFVWFHWTMCGGGEINTSLSGWLIVCVHETWDMEIQLQVTHRWSRCTFPSTAENLSCFTLHPCSATGRCGNTLYGYWFYRFLVLQFLLHL